MNTLIKTFFVIKHATKHMFIWIIFGLYFCEHLCMHIHLLNILISKLILNSYFSFTQADRHRHTHRKTPLPLGPCSNDSPHPSIQASCQRKELETGYNVVGLGDQGPGDWLAEGGMLYSMLHSLSLFFLCSARKPVSEFYHTATPPHPSPILTHFIYHTFPLPAPK